MRKGIVEVKSVNNKKFGRRKKEKMKTRILAIVEIAVVLCSLFLVALPAVAAEQNEGMQEVSANTITTASEDDYVLGVYGNANEDDTIDMGDVVYTKLAIFGKKPKTELCDAKYDERINVLDVIQTKLIILGKEKELTFVDTSDRVVTVKKPIERLISANWGSTEALRSIKATDKLVAVDYYAAKGGMGGVYFPEFVGYPNLGRPLDYEVLFDLQPDLVLLSASTSSDTDYEKIKELDPKIAVFRLHYYRMESRVDEIRKLGYILYRKDEADEFINFYEGWLNSIEERVTEIPEEDKPRVYYEHGVRDYLTCGPGFGGYHDNLIAAGGKNIFSDLVDCVNVDPEEVIKRNPEVIIKMGRGVYGVDDITVLSDQRDEIMNRPELAGVTAVKTGRVYMLSRDICCCGGLGGNFVAIGYLAKWLHPDLFKDLNPKATHQEYLTRFQGLDYDLDEHSAFVYPEPS